MSTNTDLVRSGYEALIRGDLDAIARVVAPDVNWRGWDDPSGDCHNRDEALEVMQMRVSQHAIGELKEVSEIDDARVLVITALSPDSEVSPEVLGLAQGHDEMANVVTIRDGTVVEMLDYKTKADALKAVHEGTAK